MKFHFLSEFCSKSCDSSTKIPKKIFVRKFFGNFFVEQTTFLELNFAQNMTTEQSNFTRTSKYVRSDPKHFLPATKAFPPCDQSISSLRLKAFPPCDQKHFRPATQRISTRTDWCRKLFFREKSVNEIPFFEQNFAQKVATA